MTDLQTLIARLEAASEGSRELDRAIHLVFFADFIKERGMVEDGDGWRDPGYGAIAPPQDYTVSLDAALPGERIVSIRKCDDALWLADALDERGHAHFGEGKTEALARRIAALKAREAT